MALLTKVLGGEKASVDQWVEAARRRGRRCVRGRRRRRARRASGRRQRNGRCAAAAAVVVVAWTGVTLRLTRLVVAVPA